MASLTKLNPSLFFTARGHHLRRHAYCCSRLALRGPKGAIAAAAAGDSPPPSSSRADAENAGVAGFCIIEGPNTVQDFAAMELQEIRDNIMSRRNKIFLLMEEVRRLRIQLRIKNAEQGVEDDRDTPEYPSSIPFFPPLKTETLKLYYAICFGLIASIMLFGGLLAPSLELKLGLGGSSYKDFIQMLHLPLQLSQVDPIVASFSGGAVGVISALMVVEINNVKQQDYKRCKYCVGTGYLACARCSGTGTVLILPDTASPEVPAGGAAAAGARGKSKIRRTTTQRCPNCSGAAKVMCPTCLCTGMALASEHDPRIDPFD
ncbi:protein ORANGE, chloroplastic isoform X1 [Selaginella moellendorffii]|uniref:protein ORANGE, chloroplastic isoform X1 n=2 Tax=Selaginella moellendorffii TaxID=88036 RepID=UPI000D1CB5B1|nr:protein ORANGE, chloroplastic isoform X1 [Selaginella moellendorffii]|eukprot:XP_024516436.1 protein ORANGE, chloroplastic isoform X1 [Selaginella moellendorffii]